MNNGDAHLALAKIYTLRGPSGEEKATSLLRRALRLKKDDISEAAKEEARALLRSMHK
jgi:hypothetical protein